jgi:hypothetical protein
MVIYSPTFGQTKPKSTSLDIEIYAGKNGNLYTNGSNLIFIITKDTSTKFTVKSSQGIVWELGKYMFFVDSLKKGKATITVFKTKPGKDILVKAKSYNVLVPKAVTSYNALKISPDVSLGGFTSGKVQLDTLKKINSISINENYTILQATLYIGQTDLQQTSIKSKYFDNPLKEIWKRIMPNCYITIDNIEFMDKNGNRYFYPTRISVMATE